MFPYESAGNIQENCIYSFLLWTPCQELRTNQKPLPNKILSEILIRSAEDYSLLLPNELPDVFMASELAKAIKRTSRYTFYVLKLLEAAGAITECGKRGRAQLYQKTKT